MAYGWVYPTGYIDIESSWGDETQAYDTGEYHLTTHAFNYISSGIWTNFVEFTIASISCDKIQFNLSMTGSATYIYINVAVYYNAEWHSVYYGTFIINTVDRRDTFIEQLLGGTYNVTKMRIRFWNGTGILREARINEVQFNSLQPVTIPTVTTQAVTSIGAISAVGNGNITNTGGVNCTKRGICWNTTGSPTIANYKSESTGTFGTGAFTNAITGLLPKTTYYVKAYAYNSVGYAYGNEVSFMTISAIPSVTTQPCTEITTVSAMGNGYITKTGGANATTQGFCYMAGTSGDPTTANSKVYDTGSFGVGAFAKAITGLTPGTGYRVRAYAINESGTGYGTTVQITTFNPPTVTTQAVTNIGSDSATGNGTITATGGINATKRGVCYNLTGSPTIANSIVEETGDFGTGAFTAVITGLSAGITYYVKAYAYNSAGYSYGAEVNFTTNKTIPTVTTQSCTSPAETTVTANGNITVSGGENADIRGFEYGLTQIGTWQVEDTGSYTVGAFSKQLVDLVTDTLYWVRAYAHNSIGYSYGEWVQFLTAVPGVVPTGAKTSICSDYFGYTYKLNASLTDDGNPYPSYFVLATDLADTEGLHFKKRLLDLFSYFESKVSGTAKIYIKRDNEQTWQYAGEVSMVGDEDIIERHLPVDSLAKHFLIRYEFVSDFDYIGLVTEAVPIGVR